MTIFGAVTEGADRTATGDGMSGVKDSGRENGHANIDAIDPYATWVSRFAALKLWHFRPDASNVDNLTPLLGFVGYEPSERGGGTGKHRAAELGKPRLDLRIGEAGTISAGVLDALPDLPTVDDRQARVLSDDRGPISKT
jgi:hypothetical protein